MLSNIEIGNLAGNGVFQGSVQVSSVIQANTIISETLDGSSRARKRNQLAQQIIDDARSKFESFAWALALNPTVQAELTFDSNGIPVVSDATLLTATAEVWDNIAGVITGDEVIPAPFTPPTP